MTTLILVRHGQSESNLKKIFTGQGNTPLTELGLRQAENTARFLRDEPIDVIYSSDLERAMQTAAPTAKLHGLPILADPALREICAGAWEGRGYEELMQIYPESYERWRNDCGNAHPEGGESVLQLADRIYAAVDRILQKERGKCVAVFSHATPLRALLAKWEGYAPRDIAKVAFCGNASVTVVDYADDGSFSLRLRAYDQHHGTDASHFPRGIV